MTPPTTRRVLRSRPARASGPGRWSGCRGRGSRPGTDGRVGPPDGGVAENYPQLQAAGSFRQLQEKLADTKKKKVAYACQSL